MVRVGADQVIELVYGRQTAGLLLALGAAMAKAVEEAGENPKKEDWALHVEAYGAAQHAARVLLDLWTPKLRRGGNDWDSEIAVRTEMEHGVAAVEAFLGWLDEETKKPKLGSVSQVMLEFLGPIAAEMIKEFPRKKEGHREMQDWLDAYKKRKEAEEKAKVATTKKRA